MSHIANVDTSSLLRTLTSPSKVAEAAVNVTVNEREHIAEDLPIELLRLSLLALTYPTHTLARGEEQMGNQDILVKNRRRRKGGRKSRR